MNEQCDASDITHLRQQVAAMQAVLLGLLRARREAELQDEAGVDGYKSGTPLLALVQREWLSLSGSLSREDQQAAKRHLDFWMQWFGKVL